MNAKLAFTIAIVLMLGGVTTIDTPQFSYVPIAPVRLGLVASGMGFCVVAILVGRRKADDD